MKLTKNTIRELIKEEIINERDRDSSRGQVLVNRARDYYEHLVDDLEDGTLELVGGFDQPHGVTVERSAARKDWLASLQRSYTEMEQVHRQINTEKNRLDREIMRVMIAMQNVSDLYDFIESRKVWKGPQPKFVDELKPRDDSVE
tara:strand:- start:30283 stop:30717 length:435 start_codon:yes stop_codon:yes gene_type:complete